jgi:elongation factor P
MADLIEAIAIRRRSYFTYENDPHVCLDVDVSTPTARGGQTLVRIKMRNLLTQAVFDKSFRASEKFKQPDLTLGPAAFMYADGDGYHFMDQETFETLTLGPDLVGDDKQFLVENLIVQVHKFNGDPIGLVFPAHVELTVTATDPSSKTDTVSGSVTKPAVLETGLEIRVPRFVKEGDRVKVHTETREFSGRA